MKIKFLKKPRLFLGLFLMLLFASSVPLFSAGIASYYSFSNTLKQYIEEKLIAISNGRQEVLGRTIDNLCLTVSSRASLPETVNAFEKFNTAIRAEGIESEIYRLTSDQHRKPFQRYLDVDDKLEDILLIAEDGKIALSLAYPNIVGQNIYNPNTGRSTLTDLARAVNMSLSTVVSDFDLYPPANHPVLFIGSPILGNGKFHGTMVFQYKPEMLYSFARNYFELPKTGEIVFAKKVKNNLVLTTPTRFKRDAALNEFIKIGSHIGIPIQRALNGETGLGVSTDYLKEVVLARWQYVPQLRWGMVVKVTQREVFQPIYDLRNLYLTIFILLIGLLLWISFTIARRISKPIEEVRDGLKIIGQGNLDYKIGLNREDEIGDLANDIDKTTENLKNVTASRDELNKTKKELERSNSDLEQYAYVASHDLQEPLRMITSYVQLLSKKYKNAIDDTADKYINYVVDGTERMQGFINDLLQYSRVGRVANPFTAIDLNSVIDNVMKNLEVTIREKDAVVTKDNMPTIFGDDIWLTHLFQNLVNNAIKFQGAESPVVHIKAKDLGQEWLFSVSDNGIGIDEKYKDRLFVIFQRLHTRDKYPGSGIGLAVCKKIVDFYGGRIWVESQLGHGATFYFTIPKLKDDKPNPPEHQERKTVA